ncbi:MAG: hypothetical protein GWN01_13940 [Nitrosopumilaceae archaeon]|nr:hypothetical protein [Nitrosopumilaceae archaeon]NIU88380.1 hypothetical protein [Nitrosopumilaceae archaeon]NIV66661.1 hypothetical protein [Nitrosopumilaceae archaeon]NIX62565.1 hypothetical protein [Nitrosopumilaceae archaeon]
MKRFLKEYWFGLAWIPVIAFLLIMASSKCDGAAYSATVNGTEDETSNVTAYKPNSTRFNGYLNIGVDLGGGTMTIKLQRSFDGGSNWYDVVSYTSDNQEELVDKTAPVLYKLNCTSYTSGTGTVYLINGE